MVSQQILDAEQIYEKACAVFGKEPETFDDWLHVIAICVQNLHLKDAADAAQMAFEVASLKAPKVISPREVAESAVEAFYAYQNIILESN